MVHLIKWKEIKWKEIKLYVTDRGIFGTTYKVGSMCTCQLARSGWFINVFFPPLFLFSSSPFLSSPVFSEGRGVWSVAKLMPSSACNLIAFFSSYSVSPNSISTFLLQLHSQNSSILQNQNTLSSFFCVCFPSTPQFHQRKIWFFFYLVDSIF